MPRKHPQVLGVDLNRPESTRQLACPCLSLPPPTLGERRHRRLARLVASARAYVGFVRANVGGIRHRRGVSSLARQARDPVPTLSVKNVRVAVLRASD